MCIKTPLLRTLEMLCLFALLPACSHADTLVGDFEGDLDAGPLGVWNPDHTAVDDDPTALAGFVGTSFLSDDPLTTESEGVTLNSQSLVIDHYQWQDEYKPYLSFDEGFDTRQAVLGSTAFEVDVTPILPEEGWEPGVSYRQTFLAFSFDGVFGKMQRDYEEDDGGNLNEFGEPLPFTVSFPLAFAGNSSLVEDDNNPTDVRTFQQWAQEAVDREEEMELFLIFQGRDVDEFGAVIPFNAFKPVVRQGRDRQRTVHRPRPAAVHPR